MSDVKQALAKSQRMIIYRHFREVGPASAVGLTMMYGIGSPRKRISELRTDPAVIADGYRICSKRVTANNRFGVETRYNIYWAEKEEDEDAAH